MRLDLKRVFGAFKYTFLQCFIQTDKKLILLNVSEQSYHEQVPVVGLGKEERKKGGRNKIKKIQHFSSTDLHFSGKPFYSFVDT